MTRSLRPPYAKPRRAHSVVILQSQQSSMASCMRAATARGTIFCVKRQSNGLSNGLACPCCVLYFHVMRAMRL